VPINEFKEKGLWMPFSLFFVFIGRGTDVVVVSVFLTECKKRGALRGKNAVRGCVDLDFGCHASLEPGGQFYCRNDRGTTYQVGEAFGVSVAITADREVLLENMA
jgi:hypothetical protein